MNILKIGYVKPFRKKKDKNTFLKKDSQKFFIYININKIFKIDFFFNI